MTARGMTASEVKALCKRQIHHIHQQEWGWVADGAYKPLPVWEKEGYNTEDIVNNAKPEDKQIDPVYKWVMYRNRAHSTHESDAIKSTDSLSILAKCRTRALKRRRTDESEKPAGEPEEDDSFSSESSAEDGDSEEDTKKQKKGGKEPKAKAKGKAKAKASADEKVKTKVRANAKAAAKKTAQSLSSMRVVCAHPLILDVEEDLMNRARAMMKMLAAIEKGALKAASDGIDTFSGSLGNFDFKACKELEKELKKTLSKLEKKK